MCSLPFVTVPDPALFRFFLSYSHCETLSTFWIIYGVFRTDDHADIHAAKLAALGFVKILPEIILRHHADTKINLLRPTLMRIRNA